jgi:hypothetical protein
MRWGMVKLSETAPTDFEFCAQLYWPFMPWEEVRNAKTKK